MLNEKAGQHAAIALHVAVEKNDLELAKLIMAGNVDLSTKNEEFQSTPLAWAEYLGREEMAELVRAKEFSSRLEPSCRSA